MRFEEDGFPSANERRVATLMAIRDALEEKGVRFIYADKGTGEGVVMKRGK